MKDQEQNLTDAEVLRMKAEKQLKKKHKKAEKQHIEADMQRLVHELQVHQIELQMQNEELRDAYETSEIALKKYTLLYDFAPVGFFTLDIEGIISELNFTGAELLGEKRFSLTDSNLKLFVTEDTLSVFNNFLIRIFSGISKECCEVQLWYDNKPPCLVYMEGIIMEHKKKCLLSVVDISAFKKPDNP